MILFITPTYSNYPWYLSMVTKTSSNHLKLSAYSINIQSRKVKARLLNTSFDGQGTAPNEIDDTT